jgi:hypothetical protein
MQNIAVWIAYMLICKIVTRRAYFSGLALVCRLHKPEAACAVIRTSLFVCGSEIDRRNYLEVANFYMFLSLHPSKSGFLAFHVSELLQLRDHDWIPDQSRPPAPPPSLAPPQRNVVIISTPYDEVDVSERLEKGFERFKGSGVLIGAGSVPFPVVARLTFKMMPKHLREGGEFAAWAAALWRSESREIIGPLEREFGAYAAVVMDNEVPTMWYIVFEFLACLYAARMIRFDRIFRFAHEIPDGCPRPDIVSILARMAPIAKFGEAEVRAVVRERGIADAAMIVTLVDLCEGAEAGDPIQDEFDAALFIRNLVFDGIEQLNGNLEPVEVLRRMEKRMRELIRKYPKLVRDVAEITLRDCDVREEQLRKAVEYLAGL